MDFDDLLWLTERLFSEYPEVRQAEADRFDHLLVDEYQDTNGSQYRIVKALAAEHRNLCVVGDDDQAIYGWRGAEVAHILRFQRDWPDAKVVRLEINYRSTAGILQWANRLIGRNPHRHPKQLTSTCHGPKPRIVQLPDEDAEARTVVDEIAARLRAKLCQARDVAILARTNEQSRPFETELRRAGIPYVLVGGLSFYDRKEVRDVLAYLKLLVNPRDEVSLLRIINTPARGLGQAAVGRLVDAAVQAGRPAWDMLAEPAGWAHSPTVAAAAEHLRQLLVHYQERIAREPLVATVRELIGCIGYQDELARLYPDPTEQQARWRAVEEVINALASYAERTRQPSLASFLQELTLAAQEQEEDRDRQLQRDAVALMTLHAAKGLEFAEVYMVGMEEGLLPHRKAVEADGAAIEEERRLCYVGVTRAKRRLTLTLALTRLKWGKARPTIPSRFLYELTGQTDSPNYRAAVEQRLPGSAHACKRPTRRSCRTRRGTQ